MGGTSAEVVAQATDAGLPALSANKCRELGEEQLQDVLAEHPLSTRADLQRLLASLAAEVFRAASVDASRYIVTLTEDKAINAYSFIGNHLVVTTGFMDFAGTDEEMLCFVLAHELGHCELGHTERPYRRAVAADPLGAVGSVAHSLSEAVVGDSPINQSLERDADCYALRTLRTAGRTTDGAVRFFNRIDGAKRDNHDDQLLGALFGSHPDPQRRIDHIHNGCSHDK